MNHHTNALEFEKIKAMLADHALSDVARQCALDIKPFLREAELQGHLAETDSARAVLDTLGTPPLSPMENTDQSLRLAEAGALLSPEQLTAVAGFLVTCGRMASYLKKAEGVDARIASYQQALFPLASLREEITQAIRNDQVEDSASPQLAQLRRSIAKTQESIKAKLDAALRKHPAWFSDSFVVKRGERYALPVKKQYRQQVEGTVLDASGSGGTLFIEPSQVRRLSDEITELVVAEENEVRRILYTLAASVADQAEPLRQNIRTMGALDFAFAKAGLSAALNGVAPEITTERRIVIRGGRHPLLDERTCVPLDISIGDSIRGVVITGPNTGGKTVALKTVGLLSMMAQCGLHVPAKEGSLFSMHADYLCDIGDGQSISENLSTFSAHMTNIIDILGKVTSESLVLLDELGSGTDPAEGMGLAVAILETLRQHGCLFIATSHYPEVKEYAAQADRLTNARMAFDRESLEPLYRLEMGEAGESCALHIARRLGLPEEILKQAGEVAYQGPKAKASGGLVFPADNAARSTSQKPSRIQKYVPVDRSPRPCDRYQRGDSVRVFPSGEIGIVEKVADEQGMIGVQARKRKLLVRHDRLKLIVPASELYPDDYDFSIVFDTVSNRKARHKLDKGNPSGVIVYEAGDEHAP